VIHVVETLILLGALSVGGAPAVQQQPADLKSAVYTTVPADEATVTPVRGYRYGAYYPGWYGPAPRYYYRPNYYYPRRYYYGYGGGWYPGNYGYYDPYSFYYRGPSASFGFSY